MDVKVVSEYSFGEFCKTIEKHIVDGYRFDFSKNSHYPIAFVSNYSCKMIKSAGLTSTKTNTNAEEDKEVEEVVVTKQRGRPKMED